MNKSESKYFNTAQCMDEAFVQLLAKKEFEFISVKEVCARAGVHRSTFYLHYESMKDLLSETYSYLISNFTNKFENAGIKMENINIATSNLEDLIFIDAKYLIPYLEYIKENLSVFRAVFRYPELFNSNQNALNLGKTILNPIIKRFGVNKITGEYMVEYYLKGLSAIIIRWVKEGCVLPVEDIVKIMIDCVLPSKN